MAQVLAPFVVRWPALVLIGAAQYQTLCWAAEPELVTALTLSSLLVLGFLLRLWQQLALQALQPFPSPHSLPWEGQWQRLTLRVTQPLAR